MVPIKLATSSNNDGVTNGGINTCFSWQFIAGYKELISFTDKNANVTDTALNVYLIQTDYWLSYPQKITSGLESAGLTIIPTNQFCGYYQVDNVYNMAVNTGKIYVLTNDILIGYNTTTIGIVQNILMNTYPITEIVLIVFSIPIILVFFCCICCIIGITI
jgi:hypothetical protein